MSLPRPTVGDALLVAHPDGDSYNAPVTRVLGQYVYAGRGRFHVSDNRLGPFTWENHDVVYHLIPNGEQDRDGRKNVVPIHHATSSAHCIGGQELAA
jgi:hypothetical protein